MQSYIKEHTNTELRKIICAGCVRSGSTWLYNAVRLICEKSAGLNVLSAWIEEYNCEDKHDIAVIKLHDPLKIDGLWSGELLTSYRDLRAVVASLARMGWVDPENLTQVEGTLNYYLEVLEQFERIAIYSMRYESMKEDKNLELKAIGRSLGSDLSDSVLCEVANELRQISKDAVSVKTSLGHHPVTLLHPNHIGPGDNSLARRLPADTLEFIEVNYANWLTERGYPAHL